MALGDREAVSPERSRFYRIVTAAGAIFAAVSPPARADTPMSYLTSFGAKGERVLGLTWGLLILSICVVVIIGALVLAGTLLRRSTTSAASHGDMPVERSGAGLLWIVVGVGLSIVALLASTVWTVSTMAAVNKPPTEPAFTIAVTGHQWWWEAEYQSGVPAEEFSTANEIHIPVGVPVKVRLDTSDVIHSFWVPALSGKTDLIPGQTNETWIQADKPGVYRGQCTEYCGKQHAHMALVVYADEPRAFQAWRAAQLQPADVDPATDGARRFLVYCGACHTVRGTPAGGELGPDLTHLMSRSTIAAGTLPNKPAYLSGWIADPQHVKPGALMPRLDLSGSDLASIRTFLRQLD